MVSLRRIETEQKLSVIIRTGGYVILFGVFLGVTLGFYTLFNPSIFLLLINISQYEATIFFLGIYLPSFIIIVALGYVFTITPRLEKHNLWHSTTLCTSVLLCLTLSALSIFNFLSFLGCLLVLTAVTLTYTRPTFKTLRKREACFFVEIGAILVASASMLFLLMWFISRFFQTYSAGVYQVGWGYPCVLLVIEILSLLTFFMTQFSCLHGVNVGLCGILGLTMSILSFMTIIQNQYVYFNLSTYKGIFLAGTGTILTFCGALICTKLYVSEKHEHALRPSFLYRGNYCPYCGGHWTNSNKDFCSTCERSLHWELKMYFCPYCGLLVPENTGKCLHCGEEIGRLPFFIWGSRKNWVEIKRCKKGWYRLYSRKGEVCVAPLKELTSLCDISEEELQQLITEASENGEIPKFDVLLDELFELISI